MLIVCVITDAMNAHVNQSPLAGALEYAGFEVRWKNFWQKSENLKLHNKIVA